MEEFRNSKARQAFQTLTEKFGTPIQDRGKFYFLSGQICFCSPCGFVTFGKRESGNHVLLHFSRPEFFEKFNFQVQKYLVIASEPQQNQSS